MAAARRRLDQQRRSLAPSELARRALQQRERGEREAPPAEDKLPAFLRIYRDTLITVMKASIKATVAELLPVLTARPIDFDSVTGDRAADADAGGQSLANKLRTLSSEGFVQLLSAIFRIVQVHLQQAAEVKRIVEWIMGNLDGTLSVDASNPTAQHGG
ncbi:vacuolar protein sorting-associated protein 54, chloroplastic-like [Panicum virgatum]|uniref:vacuolar protein sorting-associated protein 54, chloroplastic-like n=1 Tax=Panicum virgatum TaxID=38727 RepID=UPI0019D64724|nr:vacuolar protein sorting-associated protein 54, chloroplastic-like [Panicum virgatum]